MEFSILQSGTCDEIAKGLIEQGARAGACLVRRRSQHKQGYSWVYIGKASLLAHRIVLIAKTKRVGKVARHTCDNTECIEPTHLIWGTQVENMQDMVERGRANHARGERHGKAKLTAQQVQEIRDRAAVGGPGTKAALSREYGVCDGYISQLCKGATRLGT